MRDLVGLCAGVLVGLVVSGCGDAERARVVDGLSETAETSPVDVEAEVDVAVEVEPDVAAEVEVAVDAAVEVEPDIAVEVEPDVAAEVEDTVAVSETREDTSDVAETPAGMVTVRPRRSSATCRARSSTRRSM